MIWPYKEEVLAFQENFYRLKKSVHHLINLMMKTILSDAESCAEHDPAQYNPKG